jgi:putative glycosyltransferase (TIGR04372 family)
MNSIRRIQISILYVWFFLICIVATLQKLLSYFINKLITHNKHRDKSPNFLARILDIKRRFVARVIVELFTHIEKSVPDNNLFEYFLKKCNNPKASAQLISSTAGIAISLGEHEQALQLLAVLIARYPMEMSPQQQIGIKAFILGKYTLAETIWTQCSQHREQLIKELGLDKLKARFLGPSWFLAIGHIAHLDIYLKYKIMNGRCDHKTYYSLPSGWKIPNTELMNLWSKYINTPEKSTLRQFSQSELSLLQDEFWSLPFEDGKSRMFSHAGSLVQHRWVNEGRAPLVSSTDLDVPKGESVLEKLGIPKGSWYVCLHVRESGFHKKWHKSNPGTRNADVMTYLPAIREVVARGGYVIRMGDASMRPLPKEKGIVDYALSDLKSEFMDLFLCATCKFFIGTNSGLGLVPPIFGVRCAMTNWSPVGLPQWYPSDTYIPKLIYSSKLGRLMTFPEMLFSEVGWLQFEKPLVEAGMRAVDNSPEEIKQLVIEILESDQSKSISTIESSAIDELTQKANSYKGAKISDSFIRMHADIFELV